MREIKFRAWNEFKENRPSKCGSIGKMIQDKDFNRNSIAFPFREKDLDQKFGKYFIMQYTGLKDKNDVDIYEGDIVKTNLYNSNGYVYYSSPSFGIKQKNGVCTDYNWSDFNNFEVIGNIYENPDLIKAK